MTTGRPTLLTKERQNKIAEYISAGNDQTTAAVANGVSKATFFGWMARGRAERDRLAANPKLKLKASETPYLEFVDAIEQALATAEARYVLLIAKAAQEPRTWQAAAWMLTHGPNKSKWAEVNRNEVSGPNGGPIETVVETVTDADLAALADRITGIGPVIPEAGKS